MKIIMLPSIMICIFINLICQQSYSADTISLPAFLIDSAAHTEVIAFTAKSTEGPAVRGDGTLFFTSGDIFCVKPDSVPVSIGLWNREANGLVFDYLDRLYVCELGRVWRLEPDGRTTMVAILPGKGNDITLTNDGGLFVTMPVWDGVGQVYYSSCSGDQKVVLDSVDGFPNGIEYVAEKNRLYIAFTLRAQILVYDVASDYSIKLVDSLEINSPDGFAIDTSGNFWVANFTFGRIDVYDSTGILLGDIRNPCFGTVQNCTFGGPNNSVLYIAGQKGVFKINTNTAGRSTRGGPVGIKYRKANGKFVPTLEPNRNKMIYRLDGRKVNYSTATNNNRFIRCK